MYLETRLDRQHGGDKEEDDHRDLLKDDGNPGFEPVVVACPRSDTEAGGGEESKADEVSV